MIPTSVSRVDLKGSSCKMTNYCSLVVKRLVVKDVVKDVVKEGSGEG